MPFFYDRNDAWRQLVKRLKEYEDKRDVVVLALPRGGVPVGFQVAGQLQAPLDIFLVRKLGVPGQEELAMGAIASGGVQILNSQVVNSLDIPQNMIQQVSAQEQRELERREQLFRDGHPGLPLEGRAVILVDDGMATGSSMEAAVLALRQYRVRRIVVAVPVAPPETCAWFQQQVDEVICLFTPEPFMGVGQWYEHFDQLSDEEVRRVLREAALLFEDENQESR